MLQFCAFHMWWHVIFLPSLTFAGACVTNPGLTRLRVPSRPRTRSSLLQPSNTPFWLTCRTCRRWRKVFWASWMTSTQGNCRRLVMQMLHRCLGVKASIWEGRLRGFSFTWSSQETPAPLTRWSMWERCRRSWPVCTLTCMVRWTRCLKTRGKWRATPTWTNFSWM